MRATGSAGAWRGRQDRGASLVEYGLLVAALAVLLVGSVAATRATFGAGMRHAVVEATQPGPGNPAPPTGP